jgi:hypothetical protein
VSRKAHAGVTQGGTPPQARTPASHDERDTPPYVVHDNRCGDVPAMCQAVAQAVVPADTRRTAPTSDSSSNRRPRAILDAYTRCGSHAMKRAELRTPAPLTLLRTARPGLRGVGETGPFTPGAGTRRKRAG